jgi:superfamily II RNA helicase
MMMAESTPPLSAAEQEAFRRLDEIEASMPPVLDEDQQRAIAKAERGESFFLTGKAGAGTPAHQL